MPTGACGINCDVCRLHIMGICSTCGSPQTEAGKAKLAAQKQIMGMGCPVLVCASEKGVHHCTGDCNEFPCSTFRRGNYPFSEDYLNMHERRRADIQEYPVSAETETTQEFWSRLENMDTSLVCKLSGAEPVSDNIYSIRCLNETWNVNLSERKIYKLTGNFGGEWDRQIPFMILIYLTTCGSNELSGDMTAPRELVKGGDFFQGIYRLDTKELEKEFGDNGSRFIEISESIGGVKSDKADYSITFTILPKFYTEYLLWTADEEFPARFHILVDRDTIKHFPLDAIALTLNLLTGRILFENQK